MPQLAQQLEAMVRDSLRETEDLDRAIEATAKAWETLRGQPLTPADGEMLEEIRRKIQNELRPRYKRAPDVLSAHAADWYTSEIPRNQLHRYVAHLKEKGWDGAAIDGVRDFSRMVVSRLADPREREFDVRGLVVGHVQSGKTANMTGVIARAADAGYNLIIVLAGMAENLRDQTQKRLEDDLVQGDPIHWHTLTQRNEYDSSGRISRPGEYQGFPGSKLPAPNSQQTYLAVVKKNARVLQRLKTDIAGTPRPLLQQYAVLIIDDEADQASVNAGKDEDPTTINRLIREILDRLPRKSYVGYTATPFANVLIQPFLDPDKDFQALDLYPKDFIVAIPPGEGYFGTKELFGIGDEDTELGVLKVLEEADTETLVRPDEPLPASAIAALQYYLLAATAKRARNLMDHTTMMINVSHKVQDHSTIASKITDWLSDFRRKIREGDSQTKETLRKLWAQEHKSEDAQRFGNRVVAFDELWGLLPEVLEEVLIVEENAQAEERLNFDVERPHTWIAVGGFILSRGLTLEGLTVSYFGRGSRQYDTLLQMGRWFGYRRGYEDLQRIWAIRPAIERFRMLARVEEELREEIEQYSLKRASPLDLAPRIRVMPGLQVTAPGKRRHATRKPSYFGKHRQTVRFRVNDRDWLAKNWRAGSLLLDSIANHGQSAGKTRAGYCYEDVEIQFVLDFFKHYEIDPSHGDLETSKLTDFLERNLSSLARWNIVLITGPEKNPIVAEPLGPHENVHMIARSRLSGSESQLADIGSLMSRADVVADLDIDIDTQSWATAKQGRYAHTSLPLLLLYPIYRNSPPRDPEKREPLGAVMDVLGVGLVFPEGGGELVEGNYIQVAAKDNPAAAEEEA